MKKLWIAMALVLLGGCSSQQRDMDRALQLRSRMLRQTCTFTAQITADYIDAREQFTVRCTHTPGEGLRFELTAPEEIAGVTGSVSGETGTLGFDGTVLALPLVAGERISPVCGPWVMLQALGSGQILSCTSREEELWLTLRESYEEDAPEAEVRVGPEGLRYAEISWQGRRNLTLEIGDFAFVPESEERTAVKSPGGSV